MKILDAIRPPPPVVARSYADAYFGDDPLSGFTTFSVGGQSYTVPVQTTMPGQKAEAIGNSFEGFVNGGLMGNSVIFGLASVRLRVFSEARFQYQRFNKGRPGDLWGDKSLAILEAPWPGGTTGDLLAVMILHADFAGNAYVVPINGQLVCMRPDWVDIILGERRWIDSAGRPGTVGLEKLGYNYYHGGRSSGVAPVTFLADDVAHFAPTPDPLAWYRGMSWLTPVIREVRADGAATNHKLKFFENAACQPLDAKIVIPTGWARMGDMKPGSRVVGPDGLPRLVTGVFPRGVKDVYRLTFSGGATTECCEDHVWTVTNTHDRKLGRSRNLTLRQIIDGGVRYDSGPFKWSIPMTDPVEFDHSEPLPLDPYLLGALLGDGSFRGNNKGSGGVSFCAAASDADEMAAAFQPLLPEGVTISRRDRCGWAEFYFCRRRGGPRENPLTAIVRRMGLFDKLGSDKAVPAQYLLASMKDRVALLQGLIDTDGCTASSAGAVFTNTSETLVRQLKELVESLGGSARMTPYHKKSGRPQWQVYISDLPNWVIPCRLARKVAFWDPRPDKRRRTLIAVELVRRAEVQCIKVDHEDGLYLTDDFIVTHNTPNLAVSLKEITDPTQFKAFVDAMDESHKGWENAYKTLYTGAGADVTVIGSNLQQIDFKAVQGLGETRMAQAAGVPPTVACLSEGLQGSSLNAGNFGQARRQFADMTMSNLWRNAAGSLATLVSPPDPASRLWYDTRDIPFLREDQKDQSDIQAQQAHAIRLLVDSGYEPSSVLAAIAGNDLTLMTHTGLFSIQLQEAGSPKLPEPPKVTGLARSDLDELGASLTDDEALRKTLLRIADRKAAVEKADEQRAYDRRRDARLLEALRNPPVVNVEAPVVNVAPAAVTVEIPARTTNVERDDHGRVIRTVEELAES